MAARSNARGSDDIPISIIKEGLPVLLPILAHIFDFSLQSGTFPSLWKKAIVRPLPKCHPPTEMGHLRPISILCAASKILESVALRQITEYVERNDLLDPLQSGFRKRHSTHTALLKIVDDIRQDLDNQQIVLMVGIDYSKAFDLMNINLLVEKLLSFGFSDSACAWIRSFLSDRSQVVLGPSGEMSSPVLRNTGVPQGTLNGPPFFSLFINDAPSVLNHCDHHIYADDFTIYYRGPLSSASSIIARVNEDLANISHWAETNGLRVNASKTQAMWFGTRNFVSQLRQLDLPQLHLNDQPVPYRESIKILGIELDSTLSWRQQCALTSKKCYAALSRLRKSSECIPYSTRLLLIKALIFPYLDYCAGLFPGLSKELALKLQRCKNAALRYATGTKRYEHISPIYCELGILSFNQRRDFLCISLLASILCDNKPSYIANKLRFLRSFNRLGSKRRSRLDLAVPEARLSCFQHAFIVYSARLWNSLPDELRNFYERPCFKNKLYLYVLNNVPR